MPLTSIGDLAQSFQLRRQGAALTQDIARLGRELSTGQKSDLLTATRGNTSALGDLDHALGTTSAYLSALRNVTLELDATQSVFDSMRAKVSGLGASFLAVQDATQIGLFERAVSEAKDGFAGIIADLNTSVAGRQLFSGAATDTKALPRGPQILSELETYVRLQTPTSGEDIKSAVEVWFADDGPFTGTVYQGSDDPRVLAKTGVDQSVTAVPSAISPELRAVLSSIATAAIADAFDDVLTRSEAVTLVKDAGPDTISSEAKLVSLAANVGRAQANAEAEKVRLEARSDALETARNDIVAADPFETATRLQSAESQLQLLYTLIARQSQLSLTNFLP